jgi:signal peptidase I
MSEETKKENKSRNMFYFKERKVSSQPEGRGIGTFFIEVLKVAIISLAIIIPVRYFLIQPFVVKGSSMEPNFSSGDYLIIDEISYRFIEPQRGDVIVFKYPKNPSQHYIKRIIGLPGEKILISEGNIVVYNSEHPGGFEVKEPYLSNDVRTPGEVNITLGGDEFFVLGDNRTASSDSRVWGGLNLNEIVGRAWIRGWPADEIGVIKAPIYSLIGN